AAEPDEPELSSSDEEIEPPLEQHDVAMEDVEEYEVKAGNKMIRFTPCSAGHCNADGISSADLQRAQQLIQAEQFGARVGPASSKDKSGYRRKQGTMFKNGKTTREDNYSRRHPVLNKFCSFCGSTRHSRRHRTDGSFLCDRYALQLRSILMTRTVHYSCEYQMCSNPADHLTQVCPTLAQRCKTCGYRGHNETDCFGTGIMDVTKAREVFEEAADRHVLLERRREDVGWGFYRCHPKNRTELSYNGLNQMSVSKAQQKALNRAQ
ncbi:MAG: hypothetical protein AAFY57_20660, partial [Cyanobacteria bacterium J06642_2]